MILVYSLCDEGDYFVGATCPFDGWSSSGSEAIAGVAQQLGAAGIRPSIETLREAGLDPQALARAVVIEFGSDASAFEALAPRACMLPDPYSVPRQQRRLRHLGKIQVYCRCNGGDYFAGGGCAFDGWSSCESEAIAEAAQRLSVEGSRPSIEKLREAGLSKDALPRALVIEFGSGALEFLALTPEAYLIDGQIIKNEDVGLNLL